MPRLTFERELASLREALVRMGTLVESQIEAALDALRRRDGSAAEKVRTQAQYLNELFRQIREQVFRVISTQQPVARDLRHLMGIQYIATELERMGDYAVRIARMTSTLVGLPDQPLRAEFGLMGELAIGQVHDILEALIEENELHAREVAGSDGEADRLYHRAFEDRDRAMLKYSLATAGFSVHEARGGASGLRTARTSRPDLILLDLMLPGMSGFDFCRALRKSSRVPIIMITAKDAEIDKIVGLELGADDYITKPFSIREVLARVNAVLRRAQPGANEPQAGPERGPDGDISSDRAARPVGMDGGDVKVTAPAVDPLSYPLAHPRRA